ncbi:protein kinase [Sorangium sp. So ce726]|uniref:serine/threonine-protein kinase n=1 Tax=Sorangium sp. So ce726 TaxID=3133319 RepID=UPI003F63F1C5
MTSLKPRGEDRAAARERTDAERALRAAEGGPRWQEIVAGRYAVETRIGAGGVGVVQLATDRLSGQRVALKRVDPRLVENRHAVDRLLRGARAARGLKGRYVARILDVGVEGGAPFVVSEYLEGSDVTSYLRRRGPIRVREAVKYLLQICEAVAEAHGVGILHRDIKPENLFLSFGDGAPSVKVLDFGVSAVACGVESEGPNAASGAMRTSLLFMAPEQMRSAGGIDERADIWSIGAVAYALLCGASPFDAPTELEICTKVLTEPPAPFPAGVEPPELRALLLRCLAKDPEARPSDVAKLAFALARFGGEGAEDAAERVWEALRADETVRMATPAPVEDEWEADTLADLPRMSPDDLMSDLETTAKWESPAGRLSDATLVSHAGAAWDGGDQLRASRSPPPPVLTVSPPERRSDPQAGGPGQRPTAGDTPVPLGRKVVHRVSDGAAPRVTPVLTARAQAETDAERLTVVRRGPSPWPRRLAIAFALFGMLAGIGGVWLVQMRTLDGGGSALPAAKGLAKRAAQEARSSVVARRSSAAVPAAPEPLPEPPAAEPSEAELVPASAAGPDSEAPRVAQARGARLDARRPEVIYDEVERERRRRREKLERERAWREATTRARQERDASRREPPRPEDAARETAQPAEGAREPQQPAESDGAQRPQASDGG